MAPNQIEDSDNIQATTAVEMAAVGTEGSEKPSLTGSETWNLALCLLAWACTISNLTLVVGTSAVVLLSVGGDDGMSSVPLGSFFVGAAVVSGSVTCWIFDLYGRKVGFLAGSGLGLVGTLLGALSVVVESPVLLVLASAFFGGSTAIGFFLRFAAVDVAPPHFAARAVTLVVSGGCLAAFAGPESSHATKDIFGEDLMYLGVFMMTGIFCTCNIILISLITFPPTKKQLERQQQKRDGLEVAKASDSDDETQKPSLVSLLKTRYFLIPVAVASLSWACMLQPMSLVRVVMHSTGFTTRQSLTTIDFHFTGMYGPGFFTGSLMQVYSPRTVAWGAVFCFIIALCFNQLSRGEDAGGSLGPWVMGQIVLGSSWNLGFTGSTVWLAPLYVKGPSMKAFIQAANDSIMFFFAGMWTISASYTYKAGGSGLAGWRTLNWVVAGLVACLALVLALDTYLSGGNDKGKGSEYDESLKRNNGEKNETRGSMDSEDMGNMEA